ncbi:protein Jade-1 isoform X2 [Spea bombifrons]|uniref:protein Jade-1 isoform X2 n=1 Tax=Spea bombifrons TaxID=233779 RepID=UPI00234BE643|nr:protein Jade-1 isoform X2 [Spea bombifrons]
MKRAKLPSSSEDSDDNGSLSTTWSQQSKSQHGRRSGHKDQKPSEVFRTDLITAMKLHDSHQLNAEDYYVLADPWRQEWEKGVQVPVNPEFIPEPIARVLAEKEKVVTYSRPRKYVHSSGTEPPELGYVDIRTLADGVCRYDLNEMDVAWLELINEDLREMGMAQFDEYLMERVMEEFEQRCYDNMNHAIETEEGLGIEYDEDVVCDVCQSPDGEDGNEMVFCDKCNICVHQACYGILKVPEGSWLCRTCALGVQPKCLLCPKKGGAMKPTRSGTKWVHVSCALWIPEVSIGSPEKMEPITKLSHIPSSRWALVCSLCNDKTGASIQCSIRNCRTAFHVTCAFDHGLEMKTILTEEDEVKFKSFCPKHSCGKKPDHSLISQGTRDFNGGAGTSPSHLDRIQDLNASQHGSQRKLKLQQLEDDFYTFVNVQDVSEALQVPIEVIDFIYQYWKLKRKANFNKPLITPRKDEEDNLAKREQDVLIRRLQLFTHLRQDLERVRNLTYMVTRREKMKRSVCKVQEQIFNLYTKLVDQEKSADIPMETMLLFNAQPLDPDAPKIEDLKWHSAYFRKQLSSSLGHSMKMAHKKSRSENEGKTGHSRPRCSSRKKEMQLSDCTISFERTVGRISPVQQKNETTMPEHRKRRDSRSQCEIIRAELKEKPLKHQPKPLRSSELSDKQAENKRNPSQCGGRSTAAATITKKPSGNSSNRYSGSLIKIHCSQSSVKAPTSPVKNWGGFRIPKKGERQQQQEKVDSSRPNQKRQYLGPVSPKDRTNDDLKTDNENDGYVPDVEMSDSEPESTEKCRMQRLAPSSTISRGYETDIIRRSILAS